MFDWPDSVSQDYGWWRVVAVALGWAADTPPDTLVSVRLQGHLSWVGWCFGITAESVEGKLIAAHPNLGLSTDNLMTPIKAMAAGLMVCCLELC